jgi:hypothetical protein
MATTKDYLAEVAEMVSATSARKPSPGKWPKSAVSIFSDGYAAGFKQAVSRIAQFGGDDMPATAASVKEDMGTVLESELTDELLNRGAI